MSPHHQANPSSSSPSLWPSDVCNSTDLPEFEIISLLEEQLPVYRLRADTVYGYDHDDWLHTPLVAPDTRLDLTTEQIDETLKYFCEFQRCFTSGSQSVCVCCAVVSEVALMDGGSFAFGWSGSACGKRPRVKV